MEGGLWSVLRRWKVAGWGWVTYSYALLCHAKPRAKKTRVPADREHVALDKGASSGSKRADDFDDMEQAEETMDADDAAKEEEEVVVLGESSWAERDAALRARAVELE